MDVPVNIMGLVLPALTFALAIDRVLNGLTRPFFGWVSDKIGREQTMFIAFALEAVGILALYHYGQNPMLFVLLTGMVFFAWGEIYSLFPSTCADTFGSKYAASNAGMLYTAKGTASLLVPLSSVLAASPPAAGMRCSSSPAHERRRRADGLVRVAADAPQAHRGQPPGVVTPSFFFSEGRCARRASAAHRPATGRWLRGCPPRPARRASAPRPR
jgi:hypothetical protein